MLEWVTEKYGADKVAHIVTFGSMAAKMAIKDVARVLKLDLSESNPTGEDGAGSPQNDTEKGL